MTLALNKGGRISVRKMGIKPTLGPPNGNRGIARALAFTCPVAGGVAWNSIFPGILFGSK
jgi:hypothetical protein